MNTEHW